MCDSSGWDVSPLALQKMLYLAQMQHLGETGGDPLFYDEFEAWDYGPVIPSLYHDLKMFGRKPVKDVFLGARNLDGTREARDIDYVARSLKGIKPGALVDFTHHKNGAWAKNYMPGVKGRVIPNWDILDEYAWRPKK